MEQLHSTMDTATIDAVMTHAASKIGPPSSDEHIETWIPDFDAASPSSTYSSASFGESISSNEAAGTSEPRSSRTSLDETPAGSVDEKLSSVWEDCKERVSER